MRFTIEYLLLNIEKPRPRLRLWSCHHGFTLIEALIATVLLGIAIFALLMSSQSFSKANGEGLEMSTAEFLAEQIREMTVSLPFASLAALNGQVNSPPHDSQGNSLTAYPAYSQKVTGVYLQSNDFTKTWTSGAKDFYKITVDIYLNNEKISSASWIRANY